MDRYLSNFHGFYCFLPVLTEILEKVHFFCFMYHFKWVKSLLVFLLERTSLMEC